MKQVLACIFLSACLQQTVIAQTLISRWQYEWGGFRQDDLMNMIPLPGNRYLFGATSASFPGECVKTSPNYGEEDFAIFVLDDNGNKLWENTYGGSYYEELYHVAKVPAGGFILAGSTESVPSGTKTAPYYGGSDVWVVRVDDNGNKLWDKAFGGPDFERAYKVVPTADGGFLVAGASSSQHLGTHHGLMDYLLIKLDVNGNKLWSKTYGGSGVDELHDLIVTHDGNFLLSGHSNSPPSGNKSSPSYGGFDQWMICIQHDGLQLWERSYGTSISDYGGTLLALQDGNYLITGFTPGGGGIYPSGGTGVIRKIDKHGNLLWTQSCAGQGIFKMATQSASGEIYVGGESGGGIQQCKTSPLVGGYSDLWITVFDNDGNKIGDMDYGGNDADLITDIEADDDDVFVVGWTNSYMNGNKTVQRCNQSADGWIIRLTNILYVRSPTPTAICSNNTNIDVAYTAYNVFQNGNVFTAQLSDENGDFNYFTNIGQLAGTQSGTIPSILPAGLPSSDKYKIRVVASLPADTTSGYTIAIQGPPQVHLGNDTTICSNIPLTLGTGSQSADAQFLWSDGSRGRSLTISAAGTYSCEVQNSCGSATGNIIITTKNPPITDIGDDFGFCEGTTATLQSTPQPADVSYHWNNGVTGSSITVNTAGAYWLHTTNNCGTTEDTVVVAMHPKPVGQLDKNPVLCYGTTRTLDAGPGFASYVWYDGQGGETRTVNGTGSYWVHITDNNGCETSDTATITRIAPLPAAFLPADTGLCEYEDLTLRPHNTYSQYQWNTGDMSDALEVTLPGTYWLAVTDAYGCTGSDTVQVRRKQCPYGFFMPTAFTPNRDGKNDLCRPKIYGKVMKFRFTIYNRWGQRLFDTYDKDRGWDGLIGANAAEAGTYVWTCVYQLDGGPQKVEKGTVVLVR